MSYAIKRDIVVPRGYVSSNSGYVKPFRQSHAHSTGNPISSVQNERDYLAAHYNTANYSFLVGISNGKVDIRQVAETNQGSWDVGGDWNAEGFGTVEFVEGSIKSQTDFNLAYPAYVWLLRKLNADAGNKDMTLDTSSVLGIKTHNYASATGHGSDHVDPLPFLAKWGISYAQFKKDIKAGQASGTKTATATKTATKAPTKTTVKKNAIQKFQDAKDVFTSTKTFKADKIVGMSGTWYAINYTLAGGKDATLAANGIPLSVLNNVTRGNKAPTKVGDTLRFISTYDHGTIDAYDKKTNGVMVNYNGKDVWFDADAFIKL